MNYGRRYGETWRGGEGMPWIGGGGGGGDGNGDGWGRSGGGGLRL